MPIPKHSLFRLLLMSLVIGACAAPANLPTLTPFDAALETAVVGTSTALANPTASSTPTPLFTLWISPSLPEPLRAPLAALRAVEGREIARVEDPDLALVRVEAAPELAITQWVYALAAPFPSLEQGWSEEDLQAVWSGARSKVLIDAQVADQLASRLGFPGEGALELTPADALLDRAWSQPELRALVPFEALEPRWKVLTIDGQSPIHNDFDPAGYPLTIEFGLSGDPTAVAQLAQALDWPAGNRDASRLTVLAMTGVTALVRATAWKMNLNGDDYPGLLVGDLLRAADLTHISNEAAFAPNCPPPDPVLRELRFCSHPDHISLLDQLEIDLIELTGNHVNDWGTEALSHSLALFDERGWGVFGGGADLESSLQPAIIEHNGNRLAFLGCNDAGPSYAWAGANTPGATPCHDPRLFETLERLHQEGYLVIFTYQWAESMNPTPLPQQIIAFRAAVDHGAGLVQGSQAHRPQSFEFYEGRMIHYGLGNLFFDQMQALSLRQEFIDRHVFYDGRHLSTELFTFMLEDWAQPRPMTEDEREAFLQEIFSASGW